MSLSGDALLKQQLKQELTKIRRSAMNILAGREHSTFELKTKLIKKEFQLELVEIILDELSRDGLLNEQRFTEAFIQARIRKGQGPVKIRHELHMRGISNDLLDEYLDTSFQFWQPLIERTRIKRFGSGKPVDYQEQGRQSRFLYQRGYDAEQIRRCFSQVD